MRDLAATAAHNSVLWQAAAAAAVAADPGGAVARFRNSAEVLDVGSNITADKLVAFGEHGRVLDGRSLAVHRAGGDEAAGLAEFGQRTWTPRREAFEDLWQGGRSAVYGALTTGGVGLQSYGPFHLVLVAPSAADQAAVFPGDSAQRYTDMAANLDEAAAVGEATEWSSRGEMVTAERADRASVVPEDSWQPLMESPDEYFEVVMLDPLPLTRLASVNVSRRHARDMRKARARAAAHGMLTAADQQLAGAAEVLAGWRRTLHVSVHEIED